MKKQKLNNVIIPIAAGLIILMILISWLTGFTRLMLLVIPFVSFALLGWSIVMKSKGWIIATSLLSSLGVAFLIITWTLDLLESNDWLGVICMALGIAWIVILFVTIIRLKKILWWTIIPAGILISLGLCFFNSPAGIWDLIFYCGAGVGLSLLAWGIGGKLLGLIIAGSIILTVAPGVAFSWKIIGVTNAISQTGVMLVWFGLGWALITICSRAIRDKFIWWPLIPGGILEMVGIGLYLGGNPNFTVGFINNSIIMSVLIFGSYIFFLRLNFRK